MESGNGIVKRPFRAVFFGLFLVVLRLTCQTHISYGQTSSCDTINESAVSLADPCHDQTTDSAIRDALRLVCARGGPEIGNHDIQKAIVIGLLGGYVKSNDMKHPEVLFARHLRRRYGSAVRVGVFGNHEGQLAANCVLAWLATDRKHSSSGEPLPKIILYGHSWGASQVLALAREMKQHGIPIALTIQIDTVRKFGQNDRTIPANVAKAVNFYQSRGITPGQSLIEAADPENTQILGNFHMTYRRHQINTENYRWLSRVLNRPHHQIENDPHVWEQIAELIDSEVLRGDRDSK